MRLKLTGGGHMTLDDNDGRAVQINQGYGYHFEHNKLIIEDQIVNPNFGLVLSKLKSSTASTIEIQKILALLLERFLSEKL